MVIQSTIFISYGPYHAVCINYSVFLQKPRESTQIIFSSSCINKCYKITCSELYVKLSSSWSTVLQNQL